MSLYDYRRSKCYNESTADIFKKGIDGALSSVLNNDEAFSSITSFTRGVYGSVSHERHPFNRMTSIVNKNIKIEIVYYSLDCIKSAITDIVRYSENKVREHLGIRTRINVLTVNPLARAVIDSFFAENMPAQPFIDRRRKGARDADKEAHEYDRFYDAPKSEISTERALQIERESWATTKKLTEAFAPDTDEITSSAQPNNTELKSEQQPIEETAPPKKADPPVAENGSLYSQLYSSLGQLAEFVILCKSASALEQRQFASKQSMAVDELADKINESAVELFGDIILESNGSAYTIIEDYLFLFD